MRGIPAYNFPAFDTAEKLLRDQGWAVYSPARIDRDVDGFDPDTGKGLLSITDYMRRDIQAILDSQAIAMLPGWRQSEGARLEHHVAVALGMTVLDATTGEALQEAGDPAYLRLLDEMAALHRAKAAGYSGIGARDAWANFRESELWGVSSLRGCLVRMGDKYRRCQNLLRNPANDQVGESLRDTLMDLASYALIARCLLEEKDG